MDFATARTTASASLILLELANTYNFISFRHKVNLGATIPYLLADYVAIKKFSQPKTQKWLRPFYSGVELVWNTLLLVEII